MEQNLNLYQIFYEVAGCRNFSVAARKLYISQPAVSKAISRLEEDLDTVLFHRSSRGVTLTKEGELLYQHVEQAMLSLKSGTDLLKAAANGQIRELSIGVSTTLCKYVLLPFLKPFITGNPNIKITISCQSTFDTLSALPDGTIDIGLVGIPKDIKEEKNSTITYLPFRTIEDIFVASDSYLSPFFLKTKGETHMPEILFKEASFIMLDKENISRKHADAFLSDHDLTLPHVIEVNNMDLSIEFARAGLGIACVISDFVEEDIRKGILREIKLAHRIPKRQIGFAYSSKAPMDEAKNTLIQYYQGMMK